MRRSFVPRSSPPRLPSSLPRQQHACRAPCVLCHEPDVLAEDRRRQLSISLDAVRVSLMRRAHRPEKKRTSGPRRHGVLRGSGCAGGGPKALAPPLRGARWPQGVGENCPMPEASGLREKRSGRCHVSSGSAAANGRLRTSGTAGPRDRARVPAETSPGPPPPRGGLVVSRALQTARLPLWGDPHHQHSLSCIRASCSRPQVPLA